MHLTPTDPCLMQGHPELISSPDPTLPCSHLSWVSETPCLRLNFLQITNYPRQGLGSYGLSGRWSEGERREWTWGNDLETGRKQGVLQAVEPLCPLGDYTTLTTAGGSVRKLGNRIILPPFNWFSVSHTISLLLVVFICYSLFFALQGAAIKLPNKSQEGLFVLMNARP